MAASDIEARIEAARQRYLAAIPDKVAALRNAIEADDRSTLTTLAHRLAGSAGMYELHKVGAAARELERLSHDEADSATLASAHEQVVAALRSAGAPLENQIDE